MLDGHANTTVAPTGSCSIPLKTSGHEKEHFTDDNSHTYNNIVNDYSYHGQTCGDRLLSLVNNLNF